ncbi:cation transporter [Lentinula edodes]|nr:cation transporter [Lentinula edodes]
MIPFQKAYPVIVFMVTLILVGNTAFPIFSVHNRQFLVNICLIGKSSACELKFPRTSRLHETLQFLLDHPRSCFIYLFPSHPTKFLLIVVVALNVTDWLSFRVLDIETPAIDAIPVGVRLIIGVLQAVAVRPAGFGTVTLSTLAPAVKRHLLSILALVFELTSAYRTVGLSLGIPTANYSFSGAFRPLSKLIVCLVMLRGRQRGLPVAID